VTKSVASLATCSVNRVCFVRYEKLVTDPQSEIRRVAAFAGIEIRDDQLRKIASAISPNSVGKGRKELDADALFRIEPLIRKTMQSLEMWDSSPAAGLNRGLAA
jgi:hypothetical protein